MNIKECFPFVVNKGVDLDLGLDTLKGSNASIVIIQEILRKQSF
jgi:hypothetical protein